MISDTIHTNHEYLINDEKENNDTYRVVDGKKCLSLKTNLTYKIIVTSRYVVEIKNAVIAMAKRCTLFRDALTEHEKPEFR